MGPRPAAYSAVTRCVAASIIQDVTWNTRIANYGGTFWHTEIAMVRASGTRFTVMLPIHVPRDNRVIACTGRKLG